MTIQQVVTKLQEERQNNIPSRFPCRAIMVKNVEQYCQLLSELKKISDIRIVQSSEVFLGFDVMPKYDNLKATSYQNEWVILTGVSEYLRLFSKKEADDRRFASLWSYQAPASSTGRIIIPLWGCEAQWFDPAINLNSDLRQEDFYFDCTDAADHDQTMNLLVLSGMFEQHIDKLESIQGSLKVGLQDWFEYWENPTTYVNNFVLLTKRYNSVTTTSGSISVHVLSDVFSFIKEKMQGAGVLTKDNCTAEMQNVLFEYAMKGQSLNAAILKILNVSAFSGVDIMGKWSALPDSSKRLAALWMKLYPDNTYLCHCFAQCKNIKSLAEAISHEIFKTRNDRPEWISEFKTLSSVMALKPDGAFFAELDAIPEYETRLEFLSSNSREERVYLLRMVGGWMRKDPNQVKASTKLREIYPELAAYLSDVAPNQPELSTYIAKYKSHKLENTLPNDDDVFFNGIQTSTYDYRYALLSDATDNNTAILWVDALGVEWLPLLEWTISNNRDFNLVNSYIAQATLPTETCFNDQWASMTTPHSKLDKLDKLAHKGVVDEPDYYACIEEQFAFISGIGKHISSLMEKYHRVVITGDHGTSRLAARFFHTREGVAAPKDSKVYSHGRYCEIPDGCIIALPDVQIVKGPNDVQYAVFSNYDHFKQSGFAAGADDDNAIYGEVHGGATPEEMLVPVIVVNSKKEIPLTAEWAKDTVKISMKKVKLSLKFSRPVVSLAVNISGLTGTATKAGAGDVWNIVFAGLKDGTYSATVLADGLILSVPQVKVLPALGGGDGDLP